MSFRQTIHGLSRFDRGFKVMIDRETKKISISFDSKSVSRKHKAWLSSVKKRAGLDELNPQPYWGFDDLFHKAGTKLPNCFYVRAESQKENGQEKFWYREITILQKFSFENFLRAIEKSFILIDFDARTGHNHGTKFRLKQDKLPFLYGEVRNI